MLSGWPALSSAVLPALLLAVCLMLSLKCLMDLWHKHDLLEGQCNVPHWQPSMHESAAVLQGNSVLSGVSAFFRWETRYVCFASPGQLQNNKPRCARASISAVIFGCRPATDCDEL